MTDAALQTASPVRSGLFTVAALQKAVAFAVLIALTAFFGLRAPNFLTEDNLVGILQATAVNGVLGVASTFVIITGGIDLSVGTLMTFCAVICGVVLTNWGLPMPVGVVAALVVGACCGGVSGAIIAKLRVPPFIATLGMMLLLKGLALVIAQDHPIYFNDTPNFSVISNDSLIGDFLPSLEIPNGVLILFVVAAVASIILNKSAARPLHIRARQQ